MKFPYFDTIFFYNICLTSRIFSSNLFFKMAIDMATRQKNAEGRRLNSLILAQLFSTISARLHEHLYKICLPNGHQIWPPCTRWSPAKKKIIRIWRIFFLAICSQPCKHTCQLLGKQPWIWLQHYQVRLNRPSVAYASDEWWSTNTGPELYALD